MKRCLYVLQHSQLAAYVAWDMWHVWFFVCFLCLRANERETEWTYFFFVFLSMPATLNRCS